jgi:hypothetical protein
MYSLPGTYSVKVTAYDYVGDNDTATLNLPNATAGGCVTDLGETNEPPATIANAVVQQQQSLQLPSGGQLYLYAYVTGGDATSTAFRKGDYTSITNADGNLVGALAVTRSDNNSFTSQTGHYLIGGVSVSGYSAYTTTYASNTLPGASETSDTFTVSTPGSLVIVFGLGGGGQCLSLNGYQASA